MNGPPLDPQRSPFEKFALIVTNLVRLGGLVVAVNEALVEPTIRPSAIAIAALMMAGAQSLDTFLGSFFGAPKK